MAVLLAVIGLGLLDVGLTWWGMSIGVVKEANPLIAGLLHVSPAAALGLTALIPIAAVCLVWALRHRTHWAQRAMYLLLVVRVLVMGTHAAWLSAL